MRQSTIFQAAPSGCSRRHTCALVAEQRLPVGIELIGRGQQFLDDIVTLFMVSECVVAQPQQRDQPIRALERSVYRQPFRMQGKPTTRQLQLARERAIASINAACIALATLLPPYHARFGGEGAIF